MTTQHQFLRAHAYTSATTSDILAEADRVPGYTYHLQHPSAPNWVIGSRAGVQVALSAYMAKPQVWTPKHGRAVTRKRRHDHRCLVAGVISYPEPVESLRKTGTQERADRFRIWYEKTIIWLKEQYASALAGLCFHLDESHPHFHFFVVGDAQRLHPGLKNELVNNHRLENRVERTTAYKKGVRLWLTDYQSAVGMFCGLVYKKVSKPAWRVKDRATHQQIARIDAILAITPNVDAQNQRDVLWDSAPKRPIPALTF